MKDLLGIIPRGEIKVSAAKLNQLGIASGNRDIVLTKANVVQFNDLVEVCDLAVELMGSNRAIEWLSHSQEDMAGLKPSEACMAGLAPQVKVRLKELENQKKQISGI